MFLFLLVIVHTIPICALCSIQYCIRYFEQFSSRKCGPGIFSFELRPDKNVVLEIWTTYGHNLVMNSI
jgi:hypothetical protein